MKNLKRVLLIVLVMIAFSTNAQFKFGVGGGVNLANLAGSDISNTDSRLGFNSGFMIELKLPIKLGFELDLLFSTKGVGRGVSSFYQCNACDILPGEGEVNLSYIDLPVVMKIYMAKVLSFQLGGQYSMLLIAKSDGYDVKEYINSSDVSAVLGLGLDVSKLHVSARYNYGLTSIDDAGADIKNNMFTFTLGYWIK